MFLHLQSRGIILHYSVCSSILNDIYLCCVSNSHTLKFCIFKLLIILKDSTYWWLNLYQNFKRQCFLIMSVSTATAMEISHKPASTRNLVHFPSSSVWWKCFQVLNSCCFPETSESIFAQRMECLSWNIKTFVSFLAKKVNCLAFSLLLITKDWCWD